MAWSNETSYRETKGRETKGKIAPLRNGLKMQRNMKAWANYWVN